MTRHIYEGVDSEGYGPGKDGGGAGGGGVRRGIWNRLRHALRFPYIRLSSLPKPGRLPWSAWLWMYHRLANSGRLQIGRVVLEWPMPWSRVCHGQPGYGHGRSRWNGIAIALGWSSPFGVLAVILAALTLTGATCHRQPGDPTDPNLAAVKALIATICPSAPDPVGAATLCAAYLPDKAKVLSCIEQACAGITPRPTETATVVATATATPSPALPRATAPTDVPTVAGPSPAPTSEQPIPIGGDCVGPAGVTPSFVSQVRDAIYLVEHTHRDWFQPDRWMLIHRPRLDFDFAIVNTLRGLGLDAAVDACLCDEIAVANHNDTTFHEQYAVLISSGDVRDPVSAEGFRARCTPRGWTPGMASVPVSSPAATPTRAPAPQMSACPCLNHINVGPLGQWPPPFVPHTLVDDKGESWSCYTIDTTPRFNPNGDGMPDNDDHPNYGGFCEYPGPPTWTTTGVRANSPGGAGADCEKDPKPGRRPRCGYQYAVCGMPGEKFTITAWPPLQLTDLYGNPNSPCAGDGHGTFVGEF